MERVIRNATTNRDANVRARTFKPVLAVVAFTRTVEQLRVKDMIIRFYESAFFLRQIECRQKLLRVWQRRRRRR